MEGRSTIDWLQLLCRAFGSSREKHVWCWNSNEFSLIKSFWNPHLRIIEDPTKYPTRLLNPDFFQKVPWNTKV
jgi:hypothetical protein